MKRRDFLKAAAGGVVSVVGASALGGCATRGPVGGGTTTGTGATSSTAGATTIPTTTTAPLSDAAWQQLASKLGGGLLRPGDAGFGAASVLYNPVFDGITPQAVARCASAADVATCLSFKRAYGVPLAVRSGGHCYAGYSTCDGLVVDVSPMDGISLDASGGTATVGAGARLIDLYAACAGAGVSIPGGSCPTVGVAGLTLGGGVGVLGRKFGLTCDNLLSADVVLADGSVVTASSSQHSDLFWALQGAGGGNFGVVTSFRFRTAPISDLAIFTLVFDWSAAESVVAAWLAHAPSAPPELWSNCLLLASQQTPNGSGPVARVTGVYVGSQSALDSALQPFLASAGSAPFDKFVGSAPYMQTMLIEAGCDGDTVAQCHLPSENPAGILQRSPFAAKSDYLSQPLPSSGIGALMAAVAARQSSPLLSGGGCALDASGGAINDVAPGATAFVHRSDLASLQYSGNWPSGASAAVVAANHEWLQSTWQSMRPYVSGQAYQNYIDASLPDWQQAYYGSNFRRLQQVKAAYDPADLFNFAQAIPPAQVLS